LVMAKYGKAYKGPWWADEKMRVTFERQAFEHFPGLRRQDKTVKGGKGLSYRLTMDVPFYEPRQIEVFFYPRRIPGAPTVLSDGPTVSPHRYPTHDRRSLCIWHPDAPNEERWLWQDGLLHLLGLTRLHLFREAWWRDCGQGDWPGPEAAHNQASKDEGLAK
jgi:hypothetical protein